MLELDNVDTYISRILQDETFKTNVPIIAERLIEGNFPEENIKLEDEIKKLHELIPTLSGLLQILNAGYKVDKDKPIHLELGVENPSQNAIRSKDLEFIRLTLNKSLTLAHDAQELLKRLRDEKKWRDAITDAIEGKVNAWTGLDTEFEPLNNETYKVYIDIQRIVEGFESWKKITNEISSDFGTLQTDNSHDSTENCNDIIDKITKALNNADTVFDDKFTKLLIDKVDTCIKIREYGEETYIVGLVNIKNYIRKKDAQIKEFNKKESMQDVNLDNISVIINQISIDKQKWRERLLLINESDRIYLERLNDFLKGCETRLDIPEIIVERQELDGAEKKGAVFLSKLLNLFNKTKRVTILHKNLELDFSEITLQDQLERLKDIEKYYNQMNYSPEDKILSKKAGSILDSITNKSDEALSKKKLLSHVIEKAEAILEDKRKTMKKPEEITAMWKNNQTNGIAAYLIGISPYIVFDEYLKNQKNIALSRV